MGYKRLSLKNTEGGGREEGWNEGRTEGRRVKGGMGEKEGWREKEETKSLHMGLTVSNSIQENLAKLKLPVFLT